MVFLKLAVLVVTKTAGDGLTSVKNIAVWLLQERLHVSLKYTNKQLVMFCLPVKKSGLWLPRKTAYNVPSEPIRV